MHKLLFVDDDEVFRNRLAKALAKRGLSVEVAGNFDEASRHLEEQTFDLALIDLRMPGRSGLEFLARVKEGSPATRVVVLTGFGSIATAVEAMRRGAYNYLTKPADTDDVLAAFFEKPSTQPLSSDLPPPSLSRLEWEHIQRVLHECGGNISQTARLLGLHRRSLQRKLNKAPLSR